MIVTLCGSNTYLLSCELSKLVYDFVGQYGNLAVERIDGQEVAADKLIESTQALTFLAPKKLVVMHSPSAQKQFVEHAEDILAGVSEGIDLIIVEPKIDHRSSYFKVLNKQTELKEFKDLDARELNNWVVQYVKNQQAILSSDDSQYLIERVGPNQQMLASELDKLTTYNQQINKDSIDLLTEQTPNSTIFNLLDACFSRDTKKTLSIYQQQRKLKVEPQQVIAMLAWQLNILAIVKTAGERNPNQIAKESKLNPFVVQKTTNIAQRVDLKHLKDLVRRALELDIRIKTQSIDPSEALQHFLLTVVSK